MGGTHVQWGSRNGDARSTLAPCTSSKLESWLLSHERTNVSVWVLLVLNDGQKPENWNRLKPEKLNRPWHPSFLSSFIIYGLNEEVDTIRLLNDRPSKTLGMNTSKKKFDELCVKSYWRPINKNEGTNILKNIPVTGPFIAYETK